MRCRVMGHFIACGVSTSVRSTISCRRWLSSASTSAKRARSPGVRDDDDDCLRAGGGVVAV